MCSAITPPQPPQTWRSPRTRMPCRPNPGRASAKFVPAERLPAVSVDQAVQAPGTTLVRAPHGWHRIGATVGRVGAFSIVELQKLSHDRTELVTRMIQPALWLLIFGTTFSHLHVINTGSVSYLAFLAPGIIAQSALFISIFYGIQIIWDRGASGRPGGRLDGGGLPDERGPARQSAAHPGGDGDRHAGFGVLRLP